MTPEQITKWRAIADLDARAGEPVGKALREAAAEVKRLTDALTAVDQDAAEARMERDEAKKQVERVKALHTPKPGTRIVPCSLHAPHEAWPPGRCPDCTSEPTDVCSHCIGQAHPCPTVRALDGREAP